MIIPIRCFTCGKLVADKWLEYDKRIKELKEEATESAREVEDRALGLGAEELGIKKIFDDLGLNRYCCKRMLLSHVDLVEKISNNKNDEYNYDNVK